MIVSGKACDPRVAFSSVEGSFISTAMLEGEHHAARRAGSVVGLAAARRCTRVMLHWQTGRGHERSAADDQR